MELTPKKVIEKLESKPLRVCIACRTPLQEVKNFGRRFLVCANSACSRLGLVTVVFAQLRLKADGNKETETSETSKN